MTTFANRGRGLEHAVKELFKQYEKLGIHCQQNHPEQLHDGTLVRKHGFDFQIFHNGTFYAFDCKECAPKNWPLDKAKPHQLKALLDVENNGGEAFFLVYFKASKQLVKFSARMIQCQLAQNHKTVSPDMGEATTIDLLGIRDNRPCSHSCLHSRNYGDGGMFCTKKLSDVEPGKPCPDFNLVPWSGENHEQT